MINNVYISEDFRNHRLNVFPRFVIMAELDSPWNPKPGSSDCILDMQSDSFQAKGSD